MRHMQAAVHFRYGPPEVVTVQEVLRPEVGADQLLIRVRASTVNRTDCGFRSAAYFVSRFFSGLWRPRNPVLGNEFAGEVEAIGPGVTHFRVGDRVFGYDDVQFGGHAQYKVIGQNQAVATLPDNMPCEIAVALCEGGHYALCIIRSARVQPGQRVLVNGATGAIGSAAVPLLKHAGARVTAVCDTDRMALVRALGADDVLDYTRQDFTATDQLYDFVFDAVGKNSFARCKRLLTPRGVYISTELGKHSANVWWALLTPLRKGKRVRFPLPTITQQDIHFLRELAESGQFRPVIDRHYPLAQIVEAYRYVEQGHKTGNVIITMP